jgi:hypothetical protein
MNSYAVSFRADKIMDSTLRSLEGSTNGDGQTGREACKGAGRRCNIATKSSHDYVIACMIRWRWFLRGESQVTRGRTGNEGKGTDEIYSIVTIQSYRA